MVEKQLSYFGLQDGDCGICCLPCPTTKPLPPTPYPKSRGGVEKAKEW